MATGNPIVYLKIEHMEKVKVFLGVDVSRNTLDICCANRGIHTRVSNDSKGFVMLSKWAIEHSVELKSAFFVLEYTGGYEYRFLQYCQNKSLAYCRIPGLEIKRSLGMIRGKNDRAESFRISRYGEEKKHVLQADKPLDPNFLKLRQLLSFRKRLVRENAGYKSSIREREVMFGKKKNDKISSISKKKIKANTPYIMEIESEITDIITGNESMKFNYDLITSVKGKGQVNAWMTISYTENFTSFTDGRQFAVYAGLMPFEHSSGTSIRGRTRVSHLANKEIKQELNQAAKVAIKYDSEIKAYAERKLVNKAYPLVLNNIKFKLILRMFSLVKRRVKYVKNYIQSA